MISRRLWLKLCCTNIIEWLMVFRWNDNKGTLDMVYSLCSELRLFIAKYESGFSFLCHHVPHNHASFNFCLQILALSNLRPRQRPRMAWSSPPLDRITQTMEKCWVERNSMLNGQTMVSMNFCMSVYHQDIEAYKLCALRRKIFHVSLQFFIF